MKRFLLLLLVVLILLSSCAQGSVNRVDIIEVESKLYTKNDINSAIETVKRYFRYNFSGCELLEIYYAGDEKYDEMKEWAAQYESDEAIILLSDFYVGSDGGDGSLNTDSTYEDWSWILVRNENGKWQHKTHGY